MKHPLVTMTLACLVAAGSAAQAQQTQPDAPPSSAGAYDYASKFYPHPAWLYLLPEAPHELGEHPAVIVARRARQPGPLSVAEASQRYYPHPAWLYVTDGPAHELGQHPAVLVAQRARAEARWFANR